MPEALSLRFAETVRRIAGVGRRAGWVVPSFRSPPGVAGVSRTLRRRPDGSVVVAVALRDRPWTTVLADMIEGVVVANRLGGVEAERCRALLWRTVAEDHPSTFVGPTAAPAAVAGPIAA